MCNNKTTYIFQSVALSLLFICSFSTPAYSVECMASGTTFRQATEQYANQCIGPRQDCDRIQGRWYCSSEKIDLNTFNLTGNMPDQHSPLPSPVGTNNTNASVQLNPFSNTSNTQESESLPCIDSDGDGWGWDGEESCRVNSGNSSSITAPSIPIHIEESPGAAVDSQRVCIDSDGDGWGWDGVASCEISDIRTTTTTLRNTISHQSLIPDSQTVPENCQNINSGTYHITELVTDVILTAGQSNATGNDTNYNPARHEQDRINNRVLVWTENDRWEIANPGNQTWHNKRFPSRRGRVFNHPGFQIGRAIADLDECRVVALISTAASGMPIDHWRHDIDGHYSEITQTVTDAINALPVKHQVDMIWWMQGEADNDQIISRYVYKLNDLIGMFRSESWFSGDGYFLANETGWSPYANRAIRTLGSDGNIFTDYSRGEDTPPGSFPSLPNETVQTHFNETSLRKIGDLVADKYINEYVKSK